MVYVTHTAILMSYQAIITHKKTTKEGNFNKCNATMQSCREDTNKENQKEILMTNKIVPISMDQNSEN